MQPILEPASAAHPGTHPASLLAELATVLASRDFSGSPRLSRFLSYIVREAITHNAAGLKETVIGVAVFDRAATYDPKIDPVVRTEARRLRQKLADHYRGRSSPYLQIVIPKGGYMPAFERVEAAPVCQQQKDTQEPEVRLVPEPSKRVATVFRWPLWAGAIALLAVAGMVAARSTLEQQKVLVPTQVQPLVVSAGVLLAPAFAPHGNAVAYAFREAGGHFHIFVIQPGGSAMQLTTGGETDDINPSWSPDGRQIAYLRAEHGRAQVRTVDFPGGADHLRFYPQMDFELQPDPAQSQAMLGPAWSPDGEGLVFAEHFGNPDAVALFLHPLERGSRQQITFPQGSERDLMPSTSPDSRWLGFSRNFSNSTSDLAIRAWQGGQERRLTNDRTDLRGISWFRDDLLFSSNRSGAYSLWTVSPRGGPVSPVLSSGVVAMEPSGSTDGRHVVYVDRVLTGSIFQLDLTRARPEPARELIASTRESNSPQYSPDGTRIAFTSNRTGNWELWVVQADGSAAQQLTFLHSTMLGTPRWSPDGRAIAFDARLAEHAGIYVVGADGTGLRPLLPSSRAENKQPAWSADRKWIFFSSNQQGTAELWKVDVSDGQAQRVLNRRVFDPQPSLTRPVLYFFDTRPDHALLEKHAGGLQSVNAIYALHPCAAGGDAACVERNLFFSPRCP